MAKKEKTCSGCCMKEKWEKNPRSFWARLWHWHLSFCPGWKAYMKSLPEEEREALIVKYNLKRNESV